MAEWLLSGHNPQEWTGVARPMTLTGSKTFIDDQTDWFLSQLVQDTADLDPTLECMVPVQGRLYLNISYLMRNVAAAVPFDPASVGVPARQVPADLAPPPAPPGQKLRLPWRFYRMVRWSANFYRHAFPGLYRELNDLYWQLREGPHSPLPLIWRLCEPEFHARLADMTRAHAVITLVITVIDGILREQAPQLLGLFVGQATATSLIGQRIWELHRTAEQCGPEVLRMLAEGTADLDAYQALPDAAALVATVRAFLHEYGHRGFRFERDFEAERLADHPEHILLAVAGQLKEDEPPEVRAEAARRAALEALRRMNPIQQLVWRPVLRWGRKLISWREDSNSGVALGQAAHGLAARQLARHFYPDQPDDVTMLYTLEEFLAFARSRGERRVDQETLDRRRAQFELYQAQPPPPELIWYDPLTRRWRPALEEEEMPVAGATRLAGIAASAGSGLVEGIAMVTNDPLDAARRLLALEGPVVLVTRLTDPAWSSLFRRLSAVVTELGGGVFHAAIVARENGLPAVVGVLRVTQLVRDGQRLRVDGAAGKVEVIE
jgi:phosphohistidine swiveling domain-containing protein